MGNGAMAALIHDFNADNFDHSDLDFIGGGSISSGSGERNPVGSVGGVSGASGKNWGQSGKTRCARTGTALPASASRARACRTTTSIVDLDPTYRDRFGFPLLRMTFDWHENDYNLIRYLSPKMREILEKMGATNIQHAGGAVPVLDWPVPEHHTAPAARSWAPIRATPSINKYGQVWDTPNVFVIGASLFPQNPGMNPTGTVAALAYLACGRDRQQVRQRSRQHHRGFLRYNIMGSM